MATLPTRHQDYSAWYQGIVKQASLAESSSVRGCMVIKPYGYALWENLRDTLDKAFKATGHQNAYFPLFIPKSYLSREAEHVEGFAKECAVVTHYRLKHDPQLGTLVPDPDAVLEEPLVVRPTSETIIWRTYKNWIRSYRDLPLLVNQWANVVRWEMRTRPFLRTTEFLWQEGHTAHATAEEAEAEAKQMLNIYYDILHHHMAIPVLRGEKTATERFAGALATYTVEALMQDGKALQAGTSHNLGQNFAKAFDVTYTDAHGTQQHVWGTSWGVTTRLLGALIMTHSDDKGLVLPPKMAPQQSVIIPIYRSAQERTQVLTVAHQLAETLRGASITTQVDDDDTHKPGWKFAHHEMRGIPLRLTLGPRDLAANMVEVTRRDTGTKAQLPMDGLPTTLAKLLDDIQESLYTQACKRQEAKTYYVDTFEAFQEALGQGGFIMAHWDGTSATEQAIKAVTQATIRCIPWEGPQEAGKCVFTGKPSARRVVFAQAY